MTFQYFESIILEIYSELFGTEKNPFQFAIKEDMKDPYTFVCFNELIWNLYQNENNFLEIYFEKNKTDFENRNDIINQVYSQSVDFNESGADYFANFIKEGLE